MIPPAEDNTPLTHLDIIDVLTIDSKDEAASTASSTKRAATLTMSANPAKFPTEKFEIKSLSQTKKEKLDSSYWDKNIEKK